MHRIRLLRPRSDLRLSVDAISNAISISLANPLYAPKRVDTVLQSPDNWGAALSEGALADDLLWPILHEITHHSSLNTIVGASLSALAVSHTNLAGRTFGEDDWVASDAVRYAITQQLLKPLLEGLALFAEFDAISANVPAASWSQQIAAMLFCKDDMRASVLRGEDPLTPLKLKLENLRLNDRQLLLKKKRLLSQSLADNEGYLLGYMLVKLIWNDLVTRNSYWNNSDMFQTFLIDYFFNDYEFANLLLPLPGNNIKLKDELESISDYLQYRLLLLCTNSNDYGQEFLARLLDQRNPRPSYQSFSEAGWGELQISSSLRKSCSLHFSTPDFQITRNIPRVLVAPATVKVTEYGTFEALFDDGQPTMRGPALNAGRPRDHSEVVADGSVEAVILLPSLRLVICVMIDIDLIATFDPLTGEFNDADAARACDRLASYLAIESFCAMVEDEKLFHKDTEAKRLIDAMSGNEGICKMIDLWAPFALMPDLDEADRPESSKLFEHRGLVSALSLTDSQMRLLSRASLWPLASETQIATTISKQEIYEIGEINSKSLKILGFRLLNLKGDKLQPSRI